MSDSSLHFFMSSLTFEGDFNFFNIMGTKYFLQ